MRSILALLTVAAILAPGCYVDTLPRRALGPGTLTLEAPADPVKGPLSIEATPSPAKGLLEVRFYLDGDADPFDRDLSAPYSVTLDPAALTDGEHELRAVAEWVDGTAEAAVIVTLDNRAPEVTVATPLAGERVLPPFVAPVKLEAGDASALRSASVSSDQATVALSLPDLTAEVPLTVGAELPLTRSLSYEVEDAPGNVTTGTIDVVATRERLSVAAPERHDISVPVAVPIGSQRTLVLRQDGADAHGFRGDLLWSAPTPAGLAPVFAVASGDEATVFIADTATGSPGVSLLRLDAAGATRWQQPADLATRGYLGVNYNEATDTFVATTREAAAGLTQTGKLVEIDAAGGETTLATLATDQVGSALYGAPVAGGALVVKTFDTGNGGGEPALSVYSRQGSHLWDWAPPADHQMLAILPLDAGVVAVAISDDPYGNKSPVVVGAGPEGDLWSFTPKGTEKLTSGVVFPSGDLVVQGVVNGYQGALHRLSAEGEVLWEKSYAQSIGCWRRLGERLGVCVGDQVLVLGPDGAVVSTWKLPPSPDPTASAMLIDLMPAPDDGVFALSGHWSTVPEVRIFRLSPSGEVMWRQTLAGESYVEDAHTVPEGTGLLVVAAHSGDMGALVSTFRAVVP